MTGWSVDGERQSKFVALSGDRNPLHVDAIAARRLPFGRVAVHGLHLLLEALDRIADESGAAPRRIRCTFRHPVGLDDPITTVLGRAGPSTMTASVRVDVWTAADVTVDLVDALPRIERAPRLPMSAEEPEQHSIDELAGRSGEVPIAADPQAVAAVFPRLTERIEAFRVAELVTLTRLVGMHVPGLHSMLSSLDVTFTPELGPEPEVDAALTYSVRDADERFARIVIDVRGPTIEGSVTAFVRPEPVEQRLGDLRAGPTEFEGQRWLVVGGSRGLGAMAVELLAAGGADVRLTYRTGAGDAERVASRHGTVTAHRLDVLEPDLVAVVADGWSPTHLAYFATPPIFVGVGGVYSDDLRDRFVAVYVDAFTALVEQLGPERLTGLLWPSSEAVEHEVAGLAEYADAKRAGERACRELATRHPHLTVHTPRLPRLLTDQTTSFVPVEFGDTAEEVLAALRGVNA